MIHTLDWNQYPPEEIRGGALTIGNFDGVHRGHAALLAELCQKAQAVRGPAVVLTFDPHPLKLLHPESFQPVLTTASDRAELLHARGAEHVVLLRTTPALLQLTAEEFFREVVGERMQARILVEGTNFGFGRDRQGNVDTLRELGHQVGIEVVVLAPVKLEDRRVSSSRVREALLRGAVQEATWLLDRPYRLRGTVVTGRKRGRTLGFPTANLEHLETLVPADGVYAVRVTPSVFPPSQGGDTGRIWPGAANIGPNPTFGEQAQKVEVHLIGFEGELVGQKLAVDFLDRLRETRTFPSAVELVEQLRLDVKRAEKIAGR
jgi:riboflavin kinase / FMN adenylyltransferase